MLAKPEIVEYFVANLETMAARNENTELIEHIITTLKEIQEIVPLPEQETLKEVDVLKLQAKISPIVDKLYGAKVGV